MYVQKNERKKQTQGRTEREREKRFCVVKSLGNTKKKKERNRRKERNSKNRERKKQTQGRTERERNRHKEEQRERERKGFVLSSHWATIQKTFFMFQQRFNVQCRFLS